MRKINYETPETFDLWKVNFKLLKEMYINPEYTKLEDCAEPEELRELDKLKTAKDEFQIQAAQLFSMIKPQRSTVKLGQFSLVETLKNISSINFRGYEYSPEGILDILLVYRAAPPSDYTIKGISQSKEFNGAVPLFLYGQRQFNNIQYGDWSRDLVDATPKAIHTVVGYRLGEMLGVSQEMYLEYLSKFNILAYRNKMFTDGQGNLKPYTSWKYNKVGDYEWDALTRTCRLMLCQGWIFNAQIRTNKMILDWADWGNIPKALDDVPERKYTTTSKYIDKVENKTDDIYY